MQVNTEVEVEGAEEADNLLGYNMESPISLLNGILVCLLPSALFLCQRTSLSTFRLFTLFIPLSLRKTTFKTTFMTAFFASLDGQVCVLKGDSLELLDDSNSYWWLVKCSKTEEVLKKHRNAFLF